jgi:hypothetical protein
MTAGRWAAAFLAVGIAGFAIPAAADELTAAYTRVLANPADSALSLQYALIAEGRHEYRLALSAYERVLLNDPNNVEAKRGLVRVRRIIQPASTQIFAEGGAMWQSNPELVSSGATGDFVPYAQVRVKDERPIAGVRWRSIASLYGEYYGDHHDLNYANVSGETGPLVDLGATMLTLYPSLGGAVSSSDNKFFYDEVNASAMLEGYLGGAYQWGRVRVGYRDFGASFTSDAGWYVDVRGKWSFQNVFGDRSVVSIAPWFLWSDVGGSVSSTILTPTPPFISSDTFAPGRYADAGATLEYSKKLNDRLTLALSVALSERHYATDLAPNGDNRQDYKVSPGVTLLFADAFGPQTDFRVAYRFDHNMSNDPSHRYDAHTVMASVVFRR